MPLYLKLNKLCLPDHKLLHQRTKMASIMLKEMKNDKLLAVDRSTFALSLAARKLGRGQVFSRGGSHGMLQVILAFGWFVPMI